MMLSQVHKAYSAEGTEGEREGGRDDCEWFTGKDVRMRIEIGLSKLTVVLEQQILFHIKKLTNKHTAVRILLYGPKLRKYL